MPANRDRVQETSERILMGFASREAALERFMPKKEPPPAAVTRTKRWSRKERDERLGFLATQNIYFKHLVDDQALGDLEVLKGNIENFIGFSRVPTGVAGPLRINGLHANGDFFVPLATSEGALVASVSRGCGVITAAGGARAVTLMESVQRAPVFLFSNLADACVFSQWVAGEFETLKAVASTTTRHGKLIDSHTAIIGNQVHLVFSFTTGDASGQNMVTISSDAICRSIVEKSPVRIEKWYIEGNLSGDKKPTAISFLSARGKKVVAEIEIPRSHFELALHTTPEEMFRYWRVSICGGIQSGSIGVQGHYANSLAALFLACGQDVACVSESSVGITVCDVKPNGDFYMSVTLPNLIVGTVGGGCGLYTQRECLEMMGCVGPETSRKFAEICAATVLAGEISMIAALAGGHFTRAHESLGRNKPKEGVPQVQTQGS